VYFFNFIGPIFFIVGEKPELAINPIESTPSPDIFNGMIKIAEKIARNKKASNKNIKTKSLQQLVND
jgi:hypothetical protein